MIEVINLSKSYGAFKAVVNISFHVERGGVIGFLGPNGAGKTTTMRILTCYHPATSGSASVAGYDVFTQSMEVRRRIGYLPESTPLYPEMRVREYLQFRGKLRGMSPHDRASAIDRVSHRCWLREFIDRPIGQLSKGMRQRVGLADAIMHEPELLVLDEPTIGLDPTQIRETRSLIRELGAHHTVLLSSHILSEVEQVCDRAIIIAGGKIVASGSLQELRDKLSADAKIVAEMKGPREDIERGLRGLGGVQHIDVAGNNGWHRITMQVQPSRDLREDVFQLAKERNWSLREIRLDAATLEDFFIQVTAKQQERK
jgi:ABC-2 type transport system ATP-binding protein